MARPIDGAALPECISGGLRPGAQDAGQLSGRGAPIDYKTILVEVDDGPGAAARSALAARLAARHGAHLVGVALSGVSRFFFRDAGADLGRTALAPHLAGLHRRKEQALAEFSRCVAAAGVRSWEARLVDDEAAAGLALCARYADLVVLGPGDAAAPGGAALDYLLRSCPRPLLVVPRAAAADWTPARILLAWTDGARSARAVDAALPLLRRADSVTVALFGAPTASAANEWLLPYLARHGIEAARSDESRHQDVDERLLALAAEGGADLLVMGGDPRLAHAVMRETALPLLLAG